MSFSPTALNMWPVSVVNGPTLTSTPWLLTSTTGSQPPGPKRRGQEQAKTAFSISPAVHCVRRATLLPPLVTRIIHCMMPTPSMELATLYVSPSLETFLTNLHGFPGHHLISMLAAISAVTCNFTYFNKSFHVAVRVTNQTVHASKSDPKTVHSQVRDVCFESSLSPLISPIKELRQDFGACTFSMASVELNWDLPMRPELQLSPSPPSGPRHLDRSFVTFCATLGQNHQQRATSSPPISQRCRFQGGLAEFGWSSDVHVDPHVIHYHQEPTGVASTISSVRTLNVIPTCGTGKDLYINGVNGLTILQPDPCDRFPSSTTRATTGKILLPTMRLLMNLGYAFSSLIPHILPTADTSPSACRLLTLS